MGHETTTLTFHNHYAQSCLVSQGGSFLEVRFPFDSNEPNTHSERLNIFFTTRSVRRSTPGIQFPGYKSAPDESGLGTIEPHLWGVAS
jgi:hypothetical protein